jgi:hypothetical protein
MAVPGRAAIASHRSAKASWIRSVSGVSSSALTAGPSLEVGDEVIVDGLGVGVALIDDGAAVGRGSESSEPDAVGTEGRALEGDAGAWVDGAAVFE